jgi:subtilisin family serine protease
MENFPQELKHDSGVTMRLESSRLLLKFQQAMPPDDITSRIDEFGLVLEGAQIGEQEQFLPDEPINHTERHFWVRSRDGRPINQNLVDGLHSRLADVLVWIGPVYRVGNTEDRRGLGCPLPDVLLIKPNLQSVAGQRGELGQILQQYGLQEAPERGLRSSGYRYFVLLDVRDQTSHRLRDRLLREQGELVDRICFANMPMLLPYVASPNDPAFLSGSQWNMTRIQAGGSGQTGWDISTGNPLVVIAIIDTGCNLSHPDLRFATRLGPTGTLIRGINAGLMGNSDGSTVSVPNFASGHGTLCAGVAAAIYNNGIDVAGIAGSCSIMPIALTTGDDSEVARAIEWASDFGVHVISMSFGHYDPTFWNVSDFSILWTAIASAYFGGCVIVAATGNENRGDLNRFPARHHSVIAVGGSDQNDNRKSPTSPDGTLISGNPWGANYGPGLSVVAPCVLVPTTDPGGGAPPLFLGTSAATPHVAGLAAAIIAEHPFLSPLQVRNIIERTAEKVGSIPYADEINYFNGTRNHEMGYGRINMLRSLDFADVLIKDWPADNGDEPSTPPGGDFWSSADIVVRPRDDGIFTSPESFLSSWIWRRQDNFLYVRVHNNGPKIARGVEVFVRIVPYVGLEFVYADWLAEDPTHIKPGWARASFPLVLPGESRIAAFKITKAEVEALWGSGWHPTVLAMTTAQNDYAFETAGTAGDGLVLRRNNLALRNVSVVELTRIPHPVSFPFIAGHVQNASRSMEILVDRGQLPKTMPVRIALDDDNKAFPMVDLRSTNPPVEQNEANIIFLDRTRIEGTLGGCRGVLTLEKGSRFGFSPSVRTGDVTVKGGEVTLRDNKRFVEIHQDLAVIHIEKQPNQQYLLVLHTTIPADARSGDNFHISVAQRDERGRTVGGATVVYLLNSGLARRE